jgi:hypothetical protein
MKTVEQSIHINKAPELSILFADPKLQMNFDSDTMFSNEKISEGAIGKGIRFRGKFKGMGTIEYEYADYSINRLIEHGIKIPFGTMRHRFEFTPDDSGTKLLQSITLELNLRGKILWD